MKIYDQQRLESLEEKKATHMQTWCQKDLKLESEGRPASKLTWCEPSGDHLDYRWRENIQRTSPQITERAKTMTKLRLKKCVLRHTLWELVHSIPHHLENPTRKTFWLAIFRVFSVKWIMNNILSQVLQKVFLIIGEIWAKEKSERTFETPCIYQK